jgi:hypothetical protein
MAFLFGGKHRHHHGRYRHNWHKEWKHHGRQPKWADNDYEDLKDEPIMKA